MSVKINTITGTSFTFSITPIITTAGNTINSLVAASTKFVNNFVSANYFDTISNQSFLSLQSINGDVSVSAIEPISGTLQIGRTTDTSVGLVYNKYNGTSTTTTLKTVVQPINNAFPYCTVATNQAYTSTPTSPVVKKMICGILTGITNVTAAASRTITFPAGYFTSTPICVLGTFSSGTLTSVYAANHWTSSETATSIVINTASTSLVNIHYMIVGS